MQFIFIFPYAKTRLTFRRDSQKSEGEYNSCAPAIVCLVPGHTPLFLHLSLSLSCCPMLSLVTN